MPPSNLAIGQVTRRFLSTRWILPLLLGLYAILALTSVREKSTTFDEIAHLTAGYSHWVHDDYRLYPENGMLPKRWVALPLLAGEFRFPTLEQPDWWESRAYSLGDAFFHTEGNDLGAMLRRGRAMVVLLGVALGALIYEWSRRLFGPGGGAVSLTLFAFSPTMLAHGRLMTSDMAVALAFTASLAGLWITLHRFSVTRLLVSGLAVGALAVSKFSVVLLAPIGLLLLAVRLLVGRPLIATFRGRRWVVRSWGRQLAVCGAALVASALIAVLVIWIFFGFRYSAFNHYQPERDRMEYGATIESLSRGSAIESPLLWLRDLRALPEAYLHGLGYVVHDQGSRGHPAFLAGKHSPRGWWYFFPYCFLVKTSLPVFVLLGLSVLAAAATCLVRPTGKRFTSGTRWRRLRRGLYRTAPLMLFLIVYWSAALPYGINIGHRHLLPTYPVMFILCGVAVIWFGRSRVPAALVVVALMTLAVDSVARWPHYLAYFNPLAGGPRQGYRHLVDSSLDWGQDLPGLKRWLDRNGLQGQTQTPVYLTYFGSGSPQYYGLEVRRLHAAAERIRDRGPLRRLTGGVYCISATLLQTTYTGAFGPWSEPYEREYQRLLEQVNRRQGTRESWSNVVARFRELRYARLCAYLRQREPDDSVGYSILIYRLTDEDIEAALTGPPVEIEPMVSAERGAR